MKKLRILSIGIILGGGFGAKLGSYISTVTANSDSFLLIEMGLLAGVLIGICSSTAIIMENTEVANK